MEGQPYHCAGRTGKTRKSQSDGTPEPYAPEQREMAKSKAVMAQDDPEAHQAMQEHLARNRELPHKLQAASESEEEVREKRVTFLSLVW